MCRSASRSGGTVLYTGVAMTVRIGSSKRELRSIASACSCASVSVSVSVSEGRMNCIPKPCLQEVASAT
jgi:hypothetical protein